MIYKNIIAKAWIILLFTCFLTSISAGGENNTYFEEFQNDSNFIASRGTIPPLSSEKNYLNWSNAINKCSFWMTTKSYRSDFHPSLLGFSCAGSFLIVELDPGYSDEIDESTIDKIYQKINQLCEQEGVSDVPVVFIWPYDTPHPLPDYGPDVLESAKKDPQFIASRGLMPIILEEGKKREWVDQLSNSIHMNRDLDPYFKKNGGNVIGFGLSINGYLFVEFDANTTEQVNESLISEIYQVIDIHCQQEGITDVPVIFKWGREPTLNEGRVEDTPSPDEVMITIMDKNGNYIDVHKDEVYLNEEGNYVLEDNKTTKQTSGFTSVMLILSLLLSTRVYRR